jgi:hypothetical protein
MASVTGSRGEKISANVAAKVCFWCGSTNFRRVNRSGFLQRYVLCVLGWYPWECVICRRKTLLRKVGQN